MRTFPRAAVAAAAGLLFAAPGMAQVYGSLANFDVVNNTGYVAHGFEIQIEDPAYDRSKIYSVFGLDRNFGVPPESVERYGAPSIVVTPGVGVTVRYAATFAGGAWSTGTPTGAYPNAGDSCWPLGNPLYRSGVLTCDHFGVATYGQPAKVTYQWLVDLGGASGVLSPKVAEVPAVNFIYAPPAAGQPPAPRPVAAEIEAHREPAEVFGTPYWVKVFSRHADHAVKLEDLMVGNAEVPGDNEVEVEWELFQAGGDNGRKHDDLILAPADQALVLRFEFYKYQGALKAGGEADCSGRNNQHGPDDCGGLGAYVGAQMAGFNAVQPPLAAVPEPGQWAMWLAGLGAIGWIVRRR